MLGKDIIYFIYSILFILVLSGAVLPEYTRVRVPDDHAIADLAMYNYVEVIEYPFSLVQYPLPGSYSSGHAMENIFKHFATETEITISYWTSPSSYSLFQYVFYGLVLNEYNPVLPCTVQLQ